MAAMEIYIYLRKVIGRLYLSTVQITILQNNSSSKRHIKEAYIYHIYIEIFHLILTTLIIQTICVILRIQASGSFAVPTCWAAMQTILEACASTNITGSSTITFDDF